MRGERETVRRGERPKRKRAPRGARNRRKALLRDQKVYFTVPTTLESQAKIPLVQPSMSVSQ
jgi:hypothetical protein